MSTRAACGVAAIRSRAAQCGAGLRIWRRTNVALERVKGHWPAAHRLGARLRSRTDRPLRPMTATPLQLLLAALAAAAGGAVNAIAGGGTLITFPTLLALGIPPIVANATSTVALWPGTVGSMWGYRRELQGARAWAV